MNLYKCVFYIVALCCITTPVWSNCTETESKKASYLAELSRQSDDQLERTTLIMRALSLCKRYQWWMELGHLQLGQSYLHEAADAYNRALDIRLYNSAKNLETDETLEIARANLALSNVYFLLRKMPESLLAVNDAKAFFDIARQKIPDDFYTQQGLLDDYFTTADASVLSRTINLQLARGIGLRAKDNNQVIDNHGQLTTGSEKIAAIDSSLTIQDGEVSSVSRINLQVYFDSGRADINGENKETVKRIASSLSKANILTSDEVLIVGHTDSVGAHAYNQALSVRRSESVSREMNNILGGNIALVAIGRGESDLRYPELDADSRRRNRRVELVIRRRN